MEPFDRLHSYQFVLFFDVRHQVHVDSLSSRLGEVVSHLEPGSQRLGLKFGSGQLETQFGLSGVTPSAAWSAGGGIWKLTCNLQRLDLIFDAKGYHDIADGEDVSVQSVCDRVAANLSQVPLTLSRRVTRAALILTTQANDGGPCAPLIVNTARSFLNTQVSSETDDNGDIAVRVNRTTKWKLGDSEWLINRIEAASIDVSFKPGGGVERLLAWQLDANTSPGNWPARELTQPALAEFFRMARDWLQERHTHLQESNVR